jgi:hypothetical protein
VKIYIVKRNILYLLLITSPLFVNSQLNLGIGVGQQYSGYPGFRAGYYWKALEPSVNIGVFFPNTFDIGAGMSLYYHDQSKVHKKLSYNFDLVKAPNVSIMPVHSLTANVEFYSRKIIPLQWRIGLGARYVDERFFMSASFGYFIELKEVKEKGFHINFRNKLGKG